MKTSATEGGCCSPCLRKGVMRGEDAASRLPRVSQARETHVKGRGRNSPTERGPSRQDSQGGAQDAQHRRLKTQGPRRVAPAGGSSRASGASCNLSSDGRACGGRPPTARRVVQGPTVNSKAENGKQTQNTGTFLQDNWPSLFKKSMSRVGKPDCSLAAKCHEDDRSLPPRP